jgi:hypothetical protein
LVCRCVGINDPGYSLGRRHHFRLLAPRVNTLKQVVANAQRIGDDGESWIYGAAGAEEARINNIKIVEFMRFAVSIERARFWIVAEADGAVLMRDPGERDALTEEQIPGKETFMAIVSMHRAFGLLLHE